jgi:nucleotide-binding universal stress UspA family protein
MLKRILVPLDGSECARHAFDYALSLARAEGAEVEVCSVVYPAGILGRTPIDPLEVKEIASAKQAAEKTVDDAIAKARARGVVAEGCVELGEPAATIVTRAEEIEADTIVMGTHGRSGVKRLFMGSVAEEVLRTSPCPVVIVREKVSFEGAEPSPKRIDDKEFVYDMRLIEVAPEDYERLYGEIASFMQGPGAELAGIVDMEVFGSADARRIVIVVHFREHKDWVHAQWDSRLGEFLEEVARNSKTLEFNLYRGDRFVSDARKSTAGNRIAVS